MKTLTILFALLSSVYLYSEDSKALNDKCVEMLSGIEKSAEGEKSFSDEDKAFKAANAAFTKHVKEGNDVELKYLYLRFQMLALISTNSMGMRSYERNKKDLTEPFYLQMKKQIDGGTNALEILDALHGK